MNNFDEDDIVVSGIGGHFPECDTLDELKENLFNGVDMVTSGRPRWEPGELDVPLRTGKMKTLDKCDAQYFGLIGKQCQALDPITRKVLERTYEAVFDAGLNPSDLAGSNTGVFFGSSILETEMYLMDSKTSDAYNILGRNKTMNANRISYWLDLKGPSFTLDSSWSSGLQTLAVAFDYMKRGLCDAAFVSAGSSIIHAEFSQHFTHLNMLSPDGASKSFDDGANGFARSEAVVVLFLQKAKKAKRNHGIVVNAVGKAMNFTPGHILLPKREDWLLLYRQFYEECNVDPHLVSYVEADGLACQEADAVELNAVNEFFCKNRSPADPLLIGSVKTNMGHTFASAGLCSLVKVLIAGHTATIPPNLHYSNPNKSSPALLTGKVKVVTEPTPLPGEFMAVNSFGFGGTYGHCLIRRPASTATTADSTEESNPIPRLVLLSGRNEEGIESTLTTVEDVPFSDECLKLVRDIFSKPISHHMCRGYTLLPKDIGIRDYQTYQGEKRPLWFIFTGMGSHWPTMGKDLRNLPAFRESIDRCHRILAKKGLDLWEILLADDDSLFNNILNSFISITSMQIALVDVLSALDIKPDGIIGHSAGELGAAYADGCLTLEETILASYSRGKVSNEVQVIKGMMAAVGMGYEQMKNCLPEGVEVACHNSSTNCTISGPSELVSEFAEKLKSDGVFVRKVNVSNIAYHSRYIRDFGPRLKEKLCQIIKNPKRRSPKWISSSVPESRWNEPEWHRCSAEYMTNNLLSPVYFEEACRHIPKNAIVLEIAPHGLLLSVLKRSLDKNCYSLSLTHRSAPNQVNHLLQTIGKLYMVGLQPRVTALYPEISLPVPVNTPFLGTLATWDHTVSWTSVNKNMKSKVGRDINLDLDELPHYKSFKLEDQAVLPSSVLLVLVLEVFAQSKNKDLRDIGVTLTDVVFRESLRILRARNLTLSVMYLIGTGKFEVLQGERVVLTGTVKERDPKTTAVNKYLKEVINAKFTMDEMEVYEELLESGYEYGKPLRVIGEMSNDGCAWKNSVRWTRRDDLAVLIEAIVQSAMIASPGRSDQIQQLNHIREISLDANELWKNTKGICLTLNTDTQVIGAPGINVEGLTFSPKAETEVELILEPVISARADEQLNVSYAEYFGKNVKTRQLGYSGTLSAGSRVMGIGSLDDGMTSVVRDRILSWRVPDSWSLEDAATVPLPYCLAYYMIKILADVKDFESVLVTNGISNIGLACIEVAFRHTGSVCATVSTEEEKRQLGKRFKQLGDNIIVVEAGRDGQLLLDLATKTKTMRYNYVINITHGKLIEKYLPCLSSFSSLYQVLVEDTDPNLQFCGTDNLVRHASIYGITLQSVLDSDDGDKRQLKDAMDEGMRNGVVIPLPKRIASETAGSSNGETELVQFEKCDKSKRFLSGRDKCYLIVGGDLQMSLLVAGRLIRKQAENVVIHHRDATVSESAASKIKSLQQAANLTVRHVEPFEELAVRGALKDLKNVNAVIVLPDIHDNGRDSSYPLVKSVATKFSTESCYLVCVLRPNSRGIDICSERSKSGQPTMVVLWDGRAHGKLARLLLEMDNFLCHGKDGVIDIIGNVKDKEDQDVGLDELFGSLPKSADEVEEYGKAIPEEVEVTEMRTLSPALRYVKETLPMFLIGGLTHGAQFSEKFRNSYYPTFTIQLPHLGCSSLEEMASYAVPKITSLSPGPYIIIGEQWGGCVALEVSRQLEHLGREVHTFLVSGTTNEVVEPLKSFEGASDRLEVGLLSRLLEIKDPEELQDLSKDKNWMLKMQHCTRYLSDERRGNVLKGLDAIKCRLEASLKYTTRNPLNGPVTVITKKRIPSEHLKQLCKTRADVHEVNREKSILNDEIFRMIHDTAVHKSLKR